MKALCDILFTLILVLGVSCQFASSNVHKPSVEAVASERQAGHNDIIPGAERISEYRNLLSSKRIALVVNHASRVGERHLVDTLRALELNVVKILAPEHGFRGMADAGAHVDNTTDNATGLPIISLYGKNKKPTQEQLNDVDIVVFDLQDVGVRFYTYVSTLHYVMEACAEKDIPVLILDRPNPNGFYVDGPVLQPEFQSFVGMHRVPVVYGMTNGEYGKMINGEGWLDGSIQCDLKVITCLKYDHTMTYDLPVPPSPNLPNLRSILLYPSLCFLEPTTISVGRGTTHQFQLYGHPEWPDTNFKFTPVSRPGATHPKHEDEVCYGVSLSSVEIDEVMRRRQIDLAYLIQAYETMGEKTFFTSTSFFDKLAGSSQLRSQLEQGLTEDQIRASWQAELAQFKMVRSKYLLYRDFE